MVKYPKYLSSCYNGDLRRVKIYIEKQEQKLRVIKCFCGPIKASNRAKTHSYNLSRGFDYSCKGGNMECINYFLSLGCNNYDSGLYYACIGNKFDTVKLLLSLGASDLNKALCGAAFSRSTFLLKFLINYTFKNSIEIDLNYLYSIVTNIRVLIYVISITGENTHWMISENNYLIAAENIHQIPNEYMEWFYKKGYIENHTEIIKNIIERGNVHRYILSVILNKDLVLSILEY